MKRFGTTWRETGDAWEGVYRERFHVLVWKFGSIWQTKVLVAYPAAKKQRHREGGVGICLEPSKTVQAAMRHGRAWVEAYHRASPVAPAALFAASFAQWKTLYRTRLDVLEQLFFVIGNGYAWLDGAVVSTNPEDHLKYTPEYRAERRAADTAHVQDPEVRALMDEASARIDAEEDALPIGPLPDDGHPRSFYPVSEEYSLVCTVPDDVRPEWFSVAYEAAVTLRDRSLPHCADGDGGQVPSANPGIGTQVVAELERRFPQWLDRAVKALPVVPVPRGENPHDPVVRARKSPLDSLSDEDRAAIEAEIATFLERRARPR